MTTVEGNETLPFDWDALAPLLAHPMRVTIVEALRWVGEPLSATDLRKLFDDQFTLPFLSYHVVTLARGGAFVMVRERPVRGSIEKFYFFP
jgi:hypothetical protein